MYVGIVVVAAGAEFPWVDPPGLKRQMPAFVGEQCMCVSFSKERKELTIARKGGDGEEEKGVRRTCNKRGGGGGIRKK